MFEIKTLMDSILREIDEDNSSDETAATTSAAKKPLTVSVAHDSDDFARLFDAPKSEKKNYEGHRARVRQSFFTDRDCVTKSEQDSLEYLLFAIQSRGDTKPMAKSLLERFGSNLAVINADPSELMKVDGVGESTARFLSFIPKFMRNAEIHCAERVVDVSTPIKAAEYIAPHFKFKKYECAYLISLDVHNRAIQHDLLSSGNEGSVIVSMDKLINIMHNNGAVKAIVAHNHPSGVLVPSSSDIEVTARMIHALNSVDKILCDHIVIGKDSEFVSISDVCKDEIANAFNMVNGGITPPEYRYPNRSIYSVVRETDIISVNDEFTRGIIALNRSINPSSPKDSALALSQLLDKSRNPNNVLDGVD